MALKVGELYASFGIDTSQLDSALLGISTKMGGLASTLKGLGIGLVFQKAAGALKDAVEQNMELEKQMSAVKGVTQATDSQFAALYDTVDKWGADSAFTALEVAVAMEELAKVGWSTEQIMDGLPGVINAAAASGEGLGIVAKITASSLKALGEEADQSTRFADVLNTVAVATATDIQSMGEAFKYVAPVAGSLGYSIEDVSLVLGLLADNGIDASMAGTTLRRLLLNMIDPTDKTEAAMMRLSDALRDDLGEALDDASNEAGPGMMDMLESLGISLVDSENNIKPLMQVITELRTAFQNLPDDATRTFEAAALGGTTAVAGLMAVINTTDEKFNGLTTAIENSSGSAEEMAKIMLDNLAGDMEYLNGELEKLSRTFYETVSPALREAVQWLTGVLEAINTKNKDALGFADIVEIVNNFEMPQISAMEEVATARSNVEALAKELVSLEDQLDKQILKIRLGVEMSGENAESFVSTVDKFIKTGVAAIEENQYLVNLNLSTAFGANSAEYNMLAGELFDPFFAAIQEKAGAVGGEIRNEMMLAMTDGTISPEEAARIQVLMQKYNDEVSKAMASAELKGTLLKAQMEAQLDGKALKSIVDETYKKTKEAFNTAKATKDDTIDLAYRAAATLEIDRDKQEEYIRTAKQGFMDHLASIPLEAVNVTFDMLNDMLKLPDPSSLFDGFEYLMDYGLTGIGSAIEAKSPELIKQAKGIYDGLKPAKTDLENLKSDYTKAGLEIPQALLDGLTRIEMIGQIGEGALGIAQFIAQNFGEGLDDATELTQQDLERMFAQLAEMFYADSQIADAMQDLVDEASAVLTENTSFAGSLAANLDAMFSGGLDTIGDKKEDLLKMLEALGVKAGSLLGVALPAGVAEGLQEGTMSVAQAAQSIAAAAIMAKSDVDSAVAKNTAKGTETGEAVATGEENAQEHVETASGNLHNAVTNAFEPLPPELLEMSAEAMAAMEKAITEGKAPNETAALEVADAVVKEFLLTMSKDNGKAIGDTWVTAVKDAVLAGKDALVSIAAQVSLAAEAIAKRILSFDAGETIGKLFDDGIAAGIRNGAGVIEAAARTAAEKALKAAKRQLDMKSPSKRAEKEIGYMYMAGIEKGLLGNVSLLEKASASVSEAMHDSFYVGDPSRGTVYSSRSAIRQTAKETAYATGESKFALERAELIGRAIAERLIESGALDSDVLMDGEKVGERVSQPVSRVIGRKTRTTIAGRSVQGVFV